ncbi:MAG: hypothetical protein KDA60_05900, partial [Planctomycetales bacterium]|nr:hypothetical protein [Planctomycetales bacterium]
GGFRYDVRDAGNGQVDIRARVIYREPGMSAPIHGPWISLPLYIDPPTNEPSTVVSLTLETIPPNRSVFTPRTTRIVGRVANPDGYVGGLRVEVRDTLSENVIAVGFTQSDGTLAVELAGVTPGEYVLEARVEDWDYNNQQVTWGPWSGPEHELSVSLVSSLAPALTRWELLSDTGVSATDRITANASIFGEVDLGGEGTPALVAIDAGADGTIDAIQTTDRSGRLIYEPLELQSGVYTYRAHVLLWNETTASYELSPGQALTFTWEPQDNEAPHIVAVAWQESSDLFDYANSATLQGRVANEGSLQDIAIEFDADHIDDNGNELRTTTDQWGRFELVATEVLGAGDHEMARVRTREIDTENARFLYGDWTALPAMYLVPALSLIPEIMAFNLQPPAQGQETIPETSTSRVAGDVQFNGPTDGLVAQFSWSEGGAVIGTASVNSSGRFTFDLSHLTHESTYTLWVRVGGTDSSGQPVYSEPASLSFRYLADGEMQIGSLTLLLDTESPGGSTGTDGSTQDRRVVGRVVGDGVVSGRTIEVDINGDGQVDLATVSDSAGEFQFDPPIEPTGLHSIQVRVAADASTPTSAWWSLRFVYVEDDSSAESLSLVQVLSIMDVDWQHSEAAAWTDVGDTPSLSDATHAYALLAAEHQQLATQTAAGASYDSGAEEAELAYLTAREQTLLEFLDSLQSLSPYDRVSYDWEPFVWPEVPAVQLARIPPDADQPVVLQEVEWLDNLYNYQLDPLYNAVEREASQQLLQVIWDAQDELHAQQEIAKQQYDEAIQQAIERMRQSTDDAQQAFDAAVADRPEFDQDTFTAIVDLIKDAWQGYRDRVREIDRAYWDTVTTADEQKWQQLNQLRQDELDAFTAARDAAFDDDCESPPEGERLDGSFTCSYQDDEPQAGYYYKLDDQHDHSQFDSPPERTEYERRRYEIDQDYAAKYEDVLNDYTYVVTTATRLRTTAMTDALEEARLEAYAMRLEMDKMWREFRHEVIVDQLNDKHDHLVALAEIRRVYDHELADARFAYDEALAEADSTRALAEQDARIQGLRDTAEAAYEAMQRWVSVVQTPSSLAQWNQTVSEHQHKLRLIEIDEEQASLRLENQRLEARALADARLQLDKSRADAERTRTVELSDEQMELRSDESVQQTRRDNALAQAWYDRNVATTTAFSDNYREQAVIDAWWSRRTSETTNAYCTATYYECSYVGAFYTQGWARDVYRYDWYDGRSVEIDSQQDRRDLYNVRRLVQGILTYDQQVGRANSAEKRDLAYVEATTDYRNATIDAFSSAAVEISNTRAGYESSVAVLQDSYSASIATAAADYAIAIAQAESARLLADARVNADAMEADAVETATWDVALWVLERDVKAGQLHEYVTALAGIVMEDPTPWGEYQLALKRRELENFQASTQTELPFELRAAEANIAYVQAVAAAQRHYAEQLYLDGDESLSPYVQRVETIARKEAELAASQLELYVIERSTAVRLREIDLAEAQARFQHAVVEQDAQRDRTEANSQYEADRATADLVRQGNATSSPLVQSERDDYRDAVFRANVDRASQIASARVSWTEEVGSANVEYVSRVTTASSGRARRNAAEQGDLITDVADAEFMFAIDTALAQEALAVAESEAEIAEQLALDRLDIDRFLAQSTREDSHQQRNREARRDYELAVYQRNLDAWNAALQFGTIPAFQFQVTANELALAQLRQAWTLRLDHDAALASQSHLVWQDLAAQERDLLDRRATVQSQIAARAATAFADYQRAIAAVERRLYISTAAVESDWVAEVVAMRATSDWLYTDAVRIRDNAYAEAGAEWVEWVEAAKLAYELDEISYDALWDIRADADGARDDAREAADDTYADSIHRIKMDQLAREDASQSERLFTVADSQQQAAAVRAQAALQHATVLADRSVDDAEFAAWFDRQIGLLDTSADYRLTDLELIADSQLGDALRVLEGTFTDDIANAEFAWIDADAQSQAERWAVLAQSLGGDRTAKFRADRAALYVDWLTELETAYVNYRVDRESIELAAAEAYAMAEMADERNQAFVDLRDMDSQLVLAANQSEESSRIAARDSIHEIANQQIVEYGSLEAETQLANSLLAAEITRSLALAEIAYEFRNDPTSDTASLAREAVEQQYAKDVADADDAWRRAIAATEATFAAFESLRERGKLTGQAEADREMAELTASLQPAAAVARALSTQQRWLAEDAVDSMHRESLAEVEVDFLTAQHAAQVNVARELSRQLIKVDGTHQGITIGYQDGDAQFSALSWGDGSSTGQLVGDGSYFIRHPGAGGSQVDLPLSGDSIAFSADASGEGFVMYSEMTAQERWGVAADLAAHAVVVRWIDDQWWVERGGDLLAFSPFESDLLLAALDFENQILAMLGGSLPWANSIYGQASARQSAWLATVPEILQWQVHVSQARGQFAAARANAYLDAARNLAGTNVRLNLKIAEQQFVTTREASDVQEQFSWALADLVVDYRDQIAELMRDFDYFKAEHPNANELGFALADKREVIDEWYKWEYAQLDRDRNLALAASGKSLAQVLSSLLTQQSYINHAEQSRLNESIAAAYFGEDQQGLERTLADLKLEQLGIEADAVSAAMSQLAGEQGDPWTLLARDEADLTWQMRDEPQAILARNLRLTNAAADRDQHLTTAMIALERFLGNSLRENFAPTLQAIQQTAALAITPASAEEVDLLPGALAVPRPQIGRISIVEQDYSLTQPGRISDGYYDALVGGWLFNNYYWSWWGPGAYMWSGFARSDYAWSYAYSFYGPGYYGTWYGYWAYAPYAWGWSSWRGDYTPAPTSLSSDYVIDISHTRADYEHTIAGSLASSESVQQVLVLTKDDAPPVIIPELGGITLGDSGYDFTYVAEPFAAADQIVGDFEKLTPVETKDVPTGSLSELLKLDGERGGPSKADEVEDDESGYSIG